MTQLKSKLQSGRSECLRHLLARTTLLFVMSLVLASCSSSHVFRGIPVSEPAILITAVPPLLQDRRLSCGPTCVAVVASYWDLDYSDLLSSELEESVKGNLSARDLAKLAGLLRMQHYLYRGDPVDMEQNLKRGRPLLALIPAPDYEEQVSISFNGLSVQAIRQWVFPKASHWVVVIGASNGKLILHDPAKGRILISKAKFERWWGARNNTCLLLLPALATIERPFPTTSQ